MVWWSISGQNSDFLHDSTFFQVWRRKWQWRSILQLHRWKGIQVEPVSNVCPCSVLRKCVFMVWSCKITSMLIGIYERAVFPRLEELFTTDNGYLVNHSSNGIVDVTNAFPDAENVDFDILYMPYFWHFGSTVLQAVVLVAAILDFPTLVYFPKFFTVAFFAHPTRTSSA